jgi:hypothetical protein
VNAAIIEKTAAAVSMAIFDSRKKVDEGGRRRQEGVGNLAVKGQKHGRNALRLGGVINGCCHQVSFQLL